jgi:hypothetical protein
MAPLSYFKHNPYRLQTHLQIPVDREYHSPREFAKEMVMCTEMSHGRQKRKLVELQRKLPAIQPDMTCQEMVQLRNWTDPIFLARLPFLAQHARKPLFRVIHKLHLMRKRMLAQYSCPRDCRNTDC